MQAILWKFKMLVLTFIKISQYKGMLTLNSKKFIITNSLTNKNNLEKELSQLLSRQQRLLKKKIHSFTTWICHTTKRLLKRIIRMSKIN